MKQKILIIILLCSITCFSQKHYPIKNMLGVNCFGWDLGAHPQQKNKDSVNTALQNAIISTRFSWLRIYADAGANGQAVYKDANNTSWLFNPDGRGYTTDDYITQLRKSLPDLKIDFCFQNMPLNISKEWIAAAKKSTQYRHPNTDLSNPSTWAEVANDMAAIAARGGTNTNVPDYPVYVSPYWWEQKQVMLKGSGLYNQIETGNEWDNQYSNDNPVTGKFENYPAITGAQYAVVWKAAYDRIKAVDSNMIVSSTGVADNGTQILSDAITWSKANNGGKVPFDKYQFHCYPVGWSKSVASALPPEMGMIPAVKKIIHVAGNIPCVVGEWGYDLHPLSDIGIRPFSNYTAEQVRAYFYVRTILGFAANGIESAYNYKLRQDYGRSNDDNSTIFITSNLFDDVSDGTINRRLSGDMFRQLSDYGDFVYDSTLAEDSLKVVYRFTNGKQFLYSGWTIEQFQLVTINGVNRAQFTERKINYTFPKGTRLDLQPGDTMAAQPFAGGSVELSSKPVFVLTSIAIASVPVPVPTKTIYHKGSFTLNGKRINYTMYTDKTYITY